MDARSGAVAAKAALQPAQVSERPAAPTQSKSGQAQPAPTPAPVHAAPVQPATAAPAVDRAALHQQIEQHQLSVRAPEGSAEWRSYWRKGGSAQYLAALQALDEADAAPLSTAPPAGDAAAPVQPTPAEEPAASSV